MERPTRQADHIETTEISGTQRARNKAPGSYAIGLAFFDVNWDIIKDMVALFNQMYSDSIIRDKQAWAGSVHTKENRVHNQRTTGPSHC
jgi:hypothetical protein